MADAASNGRRPPRPIRRVLVANRGEIAVRVMRTCKDRGVETVAVFSEPDRLAPHVLMADYAHAIGPAPARQSYLDIEKIIAACRASGADAVHPGYGFLSENDEFAAACERHGIAFIGPPREAMRVMGDKTAAREKMIAAGVPVVPGDNGPDGHGFPDAASARAAADAIGFPVLIKASAGGGGKGMRLVPKSGDPSVFDRAFAAARREAAAAFGDDTVYIEKAVQAPRHVEIQVFADTLGNTVHLGERDCSIQRRHQKVIEEAPSPAVTPDLRDRMGRAAVDAARACDYVGAGTVEFLLAPDGEFYFLEMNTRLQVEHPVTEAIYRLDLVAWQLDVAAGLPLPLPLAQNAQNAQNAQDAQDALDARRAGHAIECRVYAEDPVRFLPSPGVITHLRTPAGPHVRDDSGVYEGFEISRHYDPMVSKLIAWGESREDALARMRRALAEYAVRGIETNLALHRRILVDPVFCSGDYHTGFIGEFEERRQPAEDGDGAGESRADAGIAAAADAGIAAAAIAAIAGSGTSGKARDPGGREDVSGATGASTAISTWRTGFPGWRR